MVNPRRNRTSSNQVQKGSGTNSESEQEPDWDLQDEEEEEEEDDSEDEYQPPTISHPIKTKGSRTKNKRKRVEESDQEEGSDSEEQEVIEIDSDEEEELFSSSSISKKKKNQSNSNSHLLKKSKNTESKRKSVENNRKKNVKGKGKSKVNNESEDDLLSEEDRPTSIFQKGMEVMERLDPEEELQDQLKAKEAWEIVRAKKEGRTYIPTTSTTTPSTSTKTSDNQSSSTSTSSTSSTSSSSSNTLKNWLGLPDEDSIPWPTSCKEAQIQDRDSTFISFVYPLTKQSDLQLILNHLTKKVHPTISIDLLPKQFQSVPSNKRGSSHDIYSYSFLVLKRGRDGKDGPEDFTIKEGKEDDGEKWASNKIEKVMKQEGASDLICIVSRWYGGTMLGPDRFNHIENVARAAIRRFMENETIEPLREKLQELDDEIISLRKKTNPTSTPTPTTSDPTSSSSSSSNPSKINLYSDLTIQKAEKLVKARNGTIGFLKKKIKSSSNSTSTSSTFASPSKLSSISTSTPNSQSKNMIGIEKTSPKGLEKDFVDDIDLIGIEKGKEKEKEIGMGSGVIIAEGESLEEQLKDQKYDDASQLVNVDGVLRKE